MGRRSLAGVLLAAGLVVGAPAPTQSLPGCPPCETIPGRDTGEGASATPAGLWPQFKFGPTRRGRTPLIGPQTGRVRWSVPLSVQSNPVIGPDGTIYVGTDFGALVALEPDGTAKWSFGVPSYVTASPGVAPDGSIVFASEEGTLHALNPDGSLRWEHRTGEYAGPHATPAIAADGTIYVGAERLFALEPDGTVRWSYPAVVEGAPAIGPDGTIYFPSVAR